MRFLLGFSGVGDPSIRATFIARAAGFTQRAMKLFRRPAPVTTLHIAVIVRRGKRMAFRPRDVSMNRDLATLRVWDLPTRVFHWALALCVTGSVVSAKIGGNATLWHFRFGYAVFTLLLFRLAWGMVGGHWSRFVNFSYAPATALRYLRGRSRAGEFHEVGHSPLGALSVFGLLGLLALQVATGLVADDDISNAGPLVGFVSGATSRTSTAWHNSVGQWSIITLVVLHIAAIVFYLVRRQRNLVRPMLSGDKPLASLGAALAAPASVDTAGSRGLALALVVASAALVRWVVGLGA